MDRIDWLTHGHFAGREGEPFMLTLGDGSLALELTEVTESTELGGPGPAGQQRRQFSLVFLGPVVPLVPQGTYRLVHDGLGELDLFLVPIGTGDGGSRYEAAFA